jgi:hypothetical protein
VWQAGRGSARATGLSRVRTACRSWGTPRERIGGRRARSRGWTVDAPCQASPERDGRRRAGARRPSPVARHW